MDFKEGLKKQREQWRQKQAELKAKAEERKKTKEQRKQAQEERERELKKTEDRTFQEAYKKESLRLARARGKAKARSSPTSFTRKLLSVTKGTVSGIGKIADSINYDYWLGEKTPKKTSKRKTKTKKTKKRKKDPIEEFFGF